MGMVKRVVDGAWRSFRTNVLVGLVLSVPVVLTVVIVNGVFRFVTNRLLPETLRGGPYELAFRLGAVATVLLALFLIGLLTRNFVGRKLYHLADRLLQAVPVINKVYISIRQISEALVAQRQSVFQEAVLVEYPRRGIFSVAFVTAQVPPKISGELKEGEDCVALFVPTTPNPTSGMLILAPRSEVRRLPMSVADAMKLIISAGTAFPGEAGPGQPNLLDKLEAIFLKKELARKAPRGTDSP
ncbi:MAG TPA: DUF502 domain-containing protein [Kiritimatiellae bacterium]|nr:DUF502 domain-containing protein [Kiritimatiellia bacterium]